MSMPYINICKKCDEFFYSNWNSEEHCVGCVDMFINELKKYISEYLKTRRL